MIKVFTLALALLIPGSLLAVELPTLVVSPLVEGQVVISEISTEAGDIELELDEERAVVPITESQRITGTITLTIPGGVSAIRARQRYARDAPVPGAWSDSLVMLAEGQKVDPEAPNEGGEEGEQIAPSVISPSSDSPLTSNQMALEWTQGNLGVTQYWVRAGNSGSANAYFDSGRIEDANDTTIQVTGLPTNGTEILIQLSYKLPSGAWSSVVKAYTACTGCGPDAGGGGNPGEWINTELPPTLTNPTNITITSSTSTSNYGSTEGTGCDGQIYVVNLNDGQDAFITATTTITKPIHVRGGRNVHVRGIEFRPEIQPGCDIGEGNQTNTNDANIHPRIPSHKMLNMTQSHYTFLEGLDFDMKGMEADCIVMRTPGEYDDSSARDAKINAERKFSVVNSRCVGYESLDSSSIGDGIHGDAFQNQGRSTTGRLAFENFTYGGSGNGITHHGWYGSRRHPSLLKLYRMNYSGDPRYASDDSQDRSSQLGLFFTGHGKQVEIRDVYIDDARRLIGSPALNYGYINGQKVGVNGGATRLDGLFGGTPPDGDFATAATTGNEYVSPY